MNGSNMWRITTRHATLSLMASHNAQDVPPMDLGGGVEVAIVVRG